VDVAAGTPVGAVGADSARARCGRGDVVSRTPGICGHDAPLVGAVAAKRGPRFLVGHLARRFLLGDAAPGEGTAPEPDPPVVDQGH
jgi:hypothetical protein